VNIVTVSFDTIMGQMTEVSQRKGTQLASNEKNLTYASSEIISSIIGHCFCLLVVFHC